MAFFTPDFLDFFMELAAHNHKEWFNEHRKRYEQSVREPMKAFVEHMRQRLTPLEPELKELQVKNAIFRINNDIRFAKDKPLYKIHTAAVLNRGGRKEMNRPGFYMQMGPDQPFIAGGSYMPSKEDLMAIRLKIVNEADRFEKILESRDFQAEFEGLGPSKMNKRLPKGLQEHTDALPILFNKQYYYSKTYDPDRILSDDFDDFLVSSYEAAEPLRLFLKEALTA